MKKSITPGQIKANNRQLVFNYIYAHPSSSQQDLSYELHLSRPTVSSCLAEFEELGMIEKNGQIANELVGRKAATYSVVSAYRVAIGVHIHADRVSITAVNLYGEVIKTQSHPIPYSNDEDYPVEVCRRIDDFAASLMLKDEQVLGVSIVIPGLVSPDGSYVTYGKILECTGLKAESFGAHLRWPCKFIHDAFSAASAEMWITHTKSDSIYLMLSNHFGAASIIDGKVDDGKHGHAATYEHIQLQKNGERCYCGRRGCAETVLSIQSLLKGFDEDLDTFFMHVRTGKTKESAKWKKYLSYLAQLIEIIHLACDSDYILSGDLAPYISESDIQVLYKQVERAIPFPDTQDYLQVGKMPMSGISIGGALVMVQEFLSHAV